MMDSDVDRDLDKAIECYKQSGDNKFAYNSTSKYL